MRLTPEMIIPAVAFLGYGLLIGFILIRRGIPESTMWLLAGYLGLSVIWTVSVGFSLAQLSAPLFSGTRS